MTEWRELSPSYKGSWGPRTLTTTIVLLLKGDLAGFGQSNCTDEDEPWIKAEIAHWDFNWSNILQTVNIAFLTLLYSSFISSLGKRKYLWLPFNKLNNLFLQVDIELASLYSPMKT